MSIELTPADQEAIERSRAEGDVSAQAEAERRTTELEQRAQAAAQPPKRGLLEGWFKKPAPAPEVVPVNPVTQTEVLQERAIAENRNTWEFIAENEPQIEEARQRFIAAAAGLQARHLPVPGLARAENDPNAKDSGFVSPDNKQDFETMYATRGKRHVDEITAQALKLEETFDRTTIAVPALENRGNEVNYSVDIDAAGNIKVRAMREPNLNEIMIAIVNKNGEKIPVEIKRYYEKSEIENLLDRLEGNPDNIEVRILPKSEYDTSISPLLSVEEVVGLDCYQPISFEDLEKSRVRFRGWGSLLAEEIKTAGEKRGGQLTEIQWNEVIADILLQYLDHMEDL